MLLIRHLPTVSDDDPKTRTLLSGPELDDERLSPRAEPVGAWMRGVLGGRRVERIRHDSSVRCVLTATHVSHATGCHDIFEDPALRPRRWGALAGHPWAELEDIFKGMSLNDRRSYRPSGGQSWMDLEGVVMPAVHKYLGSTSGTVAIVSHLSVLRVIVGGAVGYREALETQVDPGGFADLAFEGGRWVVEKITNPPAGLA
jgi:broad specificity phosphatase PhoE